MSQNLSKCRLNFLIVRFAIYTVIVVYSLYNKENYEVDLFPQIHNLIHFWKTLID